MGIKGNSHMLMQDKNNLQLADLILAWIDQHVERRWSIKVRLIILSALVAFASSAAAQTFPTTISI